MRCDIRMFLWGAFSNRRGGYRTRSPELSCVFAPPFCFYKCNLLWQSRTKDLLNFIIHLLCPPHLGQLLLSISCTVPVVVTIIFRCFCICRSTSWFLMLSMPYPRLPFLVAFIKNKLLGILQCYFDFRFVLRIFHQRLESRLWWKMKNVSTLDILYLANQILKFQMKNATCESVSPRFWTKWTWKWLLGEL